MNWSTYGEYNAYDGNDSLDYLPSLPDYTEDLSHTHFHINFLYIVSMLIYSVVFVLGVPGNAIVIWMTGFKMKQTVNTIWFLNLSIADFLCCLFLPFSIAFLAMDHHWPFGYVLCKCIPPIIVLNMFASIFLLTVISVDRCLLVVKPIWCQNKRTASMASVVCLVVWLLALFMTIPSVVFRTTHSDKYTSKVLCTTDYSSVAGYVKTAIHVFKLVLGFFLPFLIIVTCYSLLLFKVKVRFSKSTKTFKLILAVIIGFFVCWLPYHLVDIVLLVMPQETWLIIASHLSESIAYINSCINPIVYVIIGQDFKQKFKKSLMTVLRSNFTEDSLHGNSSQCKTRSSIDQKSISTNVSSAEV
ncbi:C5a anaphylatoxin chemotactic receptor 1-like [Latimeria chalumnae]|uniref:C5a anaphylatoxin chemotactic receptor 1-like n=1 Tax=Latimeria chalumnae TaxID=7897 RepID=UPI0003C13091|nr:PREDICTED: C5a anaphylatoxin chemotactic receptor 1-like [Latimeria chalumnae]|eukprot:XP_005996096.1 PREDICTED: C5a anaphylatoxin chemotactic receptor 1-like [Latimeria chalumnae]